MIMEVIQSWQVHLSCPMAALTVGDEFNRLCSILLLLMIHMFYPFKSSSLSQMCLMRQVRSDFESFTSYETGSYQNVGSKTYHLDIKMKFELWTWVKHWVKHFQRPLPPFFQSVFTPLKLITCTLLAWTVLSDQHQHHVCCLFFSISSQVSEVWGRPPTNRFTTRVAPSIVSSRTSWYREVTSVQVSTALEAVQSVNLNYENVWVVVVM